MHLPRHLALLWTLAGSISFGAHAQDDAAEPAAPSSSEGVQRLLSALQHGETFKVRATAAVALGRMQDPRAITPLMEALRGDDHFAVRSAAASALGRLGEPLCLPALFEALKDPEEYVRDEAQEALARFHAPRHLLAFRDALHADEPITRLAAVTAYGEVMREPDSSTGVAVQVVLATGDDDDRVSSAAVRALNELPHDRALPLLVDGLKSNSSGARAGVAKILEKRTDARAVLPLRSLAIDTDQPDDVRKAAARALRAHAEYLDTSALSKNAQTAGDPERQSALRLLAVLGDSRAVALITATLKDPDAQLRIAAARAAADSYSGANAADKTKLQDALKQAASSESDPRLKRQIELIQKTMR